MPWMALIPAAISAASAVAGGIQSSNAANAAANSQKDSSMLNNILWNMQLPQMQQNVTDAYGSAQNYLQQALSQLQGSAGTSQAYLQKGIDQYGQALGNGTNAFQNGIDAYNQMLGNVTDVNQPGVNTYGAGNSLVQSLLANPSQITSMPGYQFNYGQGLQALDRGAAASGNLFSGGQQAAEQQFGQNYAQNALNQWMGYGNQAIASGQPSVNNVSNANNAWAQGLGNMNQGISNLNLGVASGLGSLAGQQATADLSNNQNIANLFGNMGSLATNEGANQNNILLNWLGGTTGQNTASGTAAAQGAYNSANSWNQALSGVGNAASQGYQNYNSANMLQQILGGQGSWGSSPNFGSLSAPGNLAPGMGSFTSWT